MVKRASAAGREADPAADGTQIFAGLVTGLRALEPPDGLWRLVVAAQILDLEADPPQIGAQGATDRLLSWPWRVALDQRIVPFRLRLDDAVRARRSRRAARPDFDGLPSELRYDMFFLRAVGARFEGLRTRPGGLAGSLGEATRLVDLARAVRAPDARWARVRDMVVDVMTLELGRVTAGRGDDGSGRIDETRDRARRLWQELEDAATAGWTSKIGSARP